MRFILIIFAGVIASFTTTTTGQAVNNEPRPVLPEITLTKLDGETFDLSSLVTNKPVYIKFWATWCLRCIQQMPHFQKAYESYGSKVDFLAINVGINNNETDIRRFLDRRPFDIPIVIDKEALAARALGVVGTPYHVLIDETGSIVHTGHEADGVLDNLLEGMANGESYTAAGKIDNSNQGSLEINFVGGIKLPLKKLVENGPIALVFATSWCESYWKESEPTYANACKAQRLALDQAFEKYGKLVQTFGLMNHYYTADKDAAEYAKHYNITYPVAVDRSGDIARKYGVTQIPTVVFLDRKGQMIFKTSGGADDVLPAFLAAIEDDRSGD